MSGVTDDQAVTGESARGGHGPAPRRGPGTHVGDDAVAAGARRGAAVAATPGRRRHGPHGDAGRGGRDRRRHAAAGAGPAARPTGAPSRRPCTQPDPDPLNFAGATAGSLGDDTAWLQGLKERIVAHGMAPDVAHVRVLWATDHAGSRHAVTIAQPTAQTYQLAHGGGRQGPSPGSCRTGT